MFYYSPPGRGVSRAEGFIEEMEDDDEEHDDEAAAAVAAATATAAAGGGVAAAGGGGQDGQVTVELTEEEGVAVESVSFL